MKTYLYLFYLLIWVEAQAQNPDNFILIKGGKYRFGRENVMIELSDFYISPTEVTYAQMAMYALDNGLDPQTFHGKSWNIPPDGERVAVRVNWFDAIRYANWLSEQQGYTPVYQVFTKVKNESGGLSWQKLYPSNKDYWAENADNQPISWDSLAWDRTAQGYRLPSEAEWKYAASGYSKLGRKQKWAGTDNVDSLQYYASYSGNNGKFAIASATLLPNPLGLYDLSGNVWEWCFDIYQDSYKNFENKINPVNDEYDNLRISNRCLRGGSWDDFDNVAEVFFRYHFIPRNRYDYYGFRLLRTP
ncbi:MAG: formylglycine-generating enzyme family protein [Microscillaceae bacterium]|jgi:formylglycine-generating enzyme required for sulfatase activity|nr:formylglycine-generating enzyme family protein [Microscillaceae bacterium]